MILTKLFVTVTTWAIIVMALILSGKGSVVVNPAGLIVITGLMAVVFGIALDLWEIEEKKADHWRKKYRLLENAWGTQKDTLINFMEHFSKTGLSFQDCINYKLLLLAQTCQGEVEIGKRDLERVTELAGDAADYERALLQQKRRLSDAEAEYAKAYEVASDFKELARGISILTKLDVGPTNWRVRLQQKLDESNKAS